MTAMRFSSGFGTEPSAYAHRPLHGVSSIRTPRPDDAAVAVARRLTVLLLLAALLPAAVLRAQQDLPPDPAADGGPVRASGNARGGRDGSADPPRQSPTTRPAATPQSGRPALAGPRFGGRGSGGFGGPGQPTLGEGPACTFDATIYDVRIPSDTIGRLDVDALAKASQTPEEFEEALAAVGAAKPVYRVNQSVRLSGDTIVIGSEVPIVINARTTDRGQTLNTVQYQSVGVLFSIAGKVGATGAIDVDLGVEVSAASDAGAVIGETAKAPIVRKATLSHKGPFQPRRPFVVVSVDGGAPDKDGKAVAFICRVTMGEPQAPAAR